MFKDQAEQAEPAKMAEKEVVEGNQWAEISWKS